MEYEIGDHVFVIKPENAKRCPFGWNDEGMDAYIGLVWEVMGKRYEDYREI